jgi:hypothetical protein
VPRKYTSVGIIPRRTQIYEQCKDLYHHPGSCFPRPDQRPSKLEYRGNSSTHFRLDKNRFTYTAPTTSINTATMLPTISNEDGELSVPAPVTN